MTASVLASAPVTQWPERLALTLVLVLLVLAVLALMRRGWVRRGARQGDIEPLPPVPEIPTEAVASGGAVEARYLGATRAYDWLDRVVVHGLGVPSAAQVRVVPARGVWVMRIGAPDLFLAEGTVVAVRHDRGIAGRVLERDGVLVITWRHGDCDLDLGLRIRSGEEAESLRASVASLIDHRRGTAPPSPASLGGPA